MNIYWRQQTIGRGTSSVLHRCQYNMAASDSDSDSSGIDDMIIQQIFFSEPQTPPHRRGSQPGKAPNINRERAKYDALFYDDYFSPTPVYGARHFRRRFRMPRELFEKIMHDVANYDSFFQQRRDASGMN
jgi:hypothetical protein